MPRSLGGTILRSVSDDLPEVPRGVKSLMPAEITCFFNACHTGLLPFLALLCYFILMFLRIILQKIVILKSLYLGGYLGKTF